MKKTAYNTKCLLCLALACVALASCKDNDYDLAHVDSTVGAGSDILEIPTSSTKNITLEDILDIRGNDLVRIDPATGYYFMDKSDSRTRSVNITVPESTAGTSAGNTYAGSLPETPVTNLGEVTIDNAPEFLSNDETVLNLDNPQFILTVKSSLPVGATVAGDLCSYDETGRKIATVHVDGLRIGKSSTSKICICRHADGIDASEYTQVKEVSDISDLLPIVPKRITFDASVKPDDIESEKVQAGAVYTISSAFRFTSPLTFNEGSIIAYTFVENEWNQDFRKLSLTDGAYMTATLNADNGIPAEMEVTAVAVDVNGNEISKDRVEVTVDRNVEASPDGIKRVVTPVTMKMTEKVERALHAVDGLKFTFKGNPAAGVQLNSKTQTLLLKDIKIYLIGKLAVDLNI